MTDGETIRTCLRTTTVQLRPRGYAGHQPGLARDLDATARAIGARAATMRRFLVACRGEPYWDGQATVSEAQVLAVQAEFARGANPAVIGGLLRRFYDLCMTTDHNVVISYVSPMHRADSQIGLKTRRSRKTGEVNPIDPGKALCRELMAAGVFPLFANDLDGSFYRSAWIETFTAIRSWHQADLAYQAETERLRREMDRLEDANPGLLDDPAVRAFVDDADRAGRRLDRRMATRWPKVRRALRSGVGLREGEAEFFGPHEELWKDVDRIGPAIAILAARDRLWSRRTTARMPDAREGSTILLSVSGTNTVPVTLRAEPAEHGAAAIAGTVLLIDADDPATTRMVPFGCLPSRGLPGLTLEVVPRGATRVAEARYQWHGREVVAEIKELRLRRRRARGVNDRTPDRAWYLDVIRNVRVAPATPAGAAPKALWDRLRYFIDSRDQSAAADVRPGLRVLSVDLGVNPALAYSVYELSGDAGPADPDAFPVPGVGRADPMAAGIVGASEWPEFHQAAREYVARCDALKALIRFRGQLMDGRELDPRAIDAAAGRFAALDLAFDSDPDSLKRTLFPQVGLMRTRLDRWSTRKQRREVERSLRGGHPDPLCRESFDMVRMLLAYIRLCRSWETNRPPGRERRQPDGFLDGLWARLNRLKRDLVRRIAGHVRRLAVEHRADVVLIEDLDRYRTSVARDKGTNGLLWLWAPATVIGWIDNALEPYGIPALRIDARYSSRIDPRTGAFGFLEFEADPKALLVRRGGSLEIIPSDIAAARNLQRRFWSRGSDVFLLRGLPDSDGAVPIFGEGDDPETAAAIRGARYFRSACGSAHARITRGRLAPLTAPAYRAAVRSSRASNATIASYFRHGEEWLAWKGHVAKVNDLFNQLASGQPASEEIQTFVARVRACWSARLKKQVGRAL